MTERQPRRVVLRADAGGKIGFGHYVRTVALAAYLKDEFDVRVATRNPDLGHPSDYQRELAEQSGVGLLELRGAEREEFDLQFLASVGPEDIAVLDNYYYPTEYQTAVRNSCRALVCIDDMHDRHFTADVVMTFCPLTAADFSMEPYTRFLGGIEWSFLREPFLRGPLPERGEAVSNRPLRIVTAMGGADPFHLTDKVVGIVKTLQPEARIDIFAGQTVETRYDAGTTENIRVWRQADAGQIAGLFDAADLGIFPASTVCVEAFARRLPVAVGHYVNNQEEFYAHGVAAGWFAPLGNLLDDPAQLMPRIEKALAEAPRLKGPEIDFAARRADIIKLFKTL